ncbi:MAG: DUF1080 domain-containing protein [Isosphaeraceae bacterium]|nr:DUF1080 domain-containing protein [Isosphaeraceae bacterium]
MSSRSILSACVILGLACVAVASALTPAAEPGKSVADRMRAWRQHDVSRPKPPVVTPVEPTRVVPAPADAVVLFDGDDLDAWTPVEGGGPARWKVADGVFEVTPGRGAIRTKQGFGDVQLHIEWASPMPPNGVGQDRGNSGLFFMGVYELQILDSHNAETYTDGQAGALYGQYPPLANASRPPGEWQSYDVAFRRPRFETDGTLIEPARMTVFHNGVLVQNNEELLGQTSWLRWSPHEDLGEKAPISLQDHGHPVRFRNIWVRPLPERSAPTAEQARRAETVALSDAALDRLVGDYALSDANDGKVVQIGRAGRNLTVKFPFRKFKLEMEPISETVFDLPKTDGRFTFRLDDKGAVKSVHFRIGDGEREYPRVAK